MKGKYKHTAEFKLQISSQASKGLKTTDDLVRCHQNYPSQNHLRHKKLAVGRKGIFARVDVHRGRVHKKSQAALHEEIDPFQFKRDGLKRVTLQTYQYPRTPQIAKSLLLVHVVGVNQVGKDYQLATSSSENLASTSL